MRKKGINIKLNLYIMEIKATLIPYSMLREDRLSWSSSPSGEFHLKDAYRIANAKESKPKIQPFSGVWVWKIPSLPRIKCFLWQCCHQSIPVRALLVERGMDISHICPMCNAAPETISHALRDCLKAQSFCNSLSPDFCFYFLWHPNFGLVETKL